MRMRMLVSSLGLLMAVGALVATVSAQNTNPRFGRWKIKSDAPPPTSNIMTYEAFGAKGMKVTIDAVNAKGEKTQWWYTTDFDGKDMPVTGQGPGRTSAVTAVNARINEIVNKTDGKTTQVLTNVLSPDGQTIAVIYMRDDGAGRTTGVTFATYEKMP